MFKKVILSSTIALLLGACDLLESSSDDYYLNTSSSTPSGTIQSESNQTPPRGVGKKS
jgi:hypothetical protein